MISRPFLLAAAGALLGLSGCIDLSLVSAVAFPPWVPGLDPGQPWVSLPVEAWVQEGELDAVAVAGCFSPACAPAAAVGIYRARGTEAARLRVVADDPDRLARALLRPPPPRPGRARATVRATAEAELWREGGRTGFTVRLARSDGSRAAHGAALLLDGPDGALTIVLVVSPSGDAARRIAREVAARAT